MQNKIIFSLFLPLIILFSACTTNPKEDQSNYNCKEVWYYNSLTWTQVYQYQYDTWTQSWIVNIPELCIQIQQEEKVYEDAVVTDIRKANREAGVIRIANTIQQNPLSEETKSQLLQQYPDKEWEIKSYAKISIVSIWSWTTLIWAIQNERKTTLPQEKCTLEESTSTRDWFIDNNNLISYHGNIENPTQNSPINGCPTIFAYQWEKRYIIPSQYPEWLYEFFWPKIIFTDR